MNIAAGNCIIDRVNLLLLHFRPHRDRIQPGRMDVQFTSRSSPPPHTPPASTPHANSFLQSKRKSHISTHSYNMCHSLLFGVLVTRRLGCCGNSISATSQCPLHYHTDIDPMHHGQQNSRRQSVCARRMVCRGVVVED